jgi:histidine triad (HIT) family protein
MSDCIFCKIIKGEIPCDKIYEDDKIFSFLDINPVSKGHALIIPKEHHENIQSAPDDILCALIVAVKKMSKAIMQTTGAQGFNLIVNSGEIAGQLVPHVHFHIIPRTEGDGVQPWPQSKYEKEDTAELAKKIGQNL